MDAETKNVITKLRDDITILYTILGVIVEKLPPETVNSIQNILGRPPRLGGDIDIIKNAINRARQHH